MRCMWGWMSVGWGRRRGVGGEDEGKLNTVRVYSAAGWRSIGNRR